MLPEIRNSTCCTDPSSRHHYYISNLTGFDHVSYILNGFLSTAITTTASPIIWKIKIFLMLTLNLRAFYVIASENYGNFLQSTVVILKSRFTCNVLCTVFLTVLKWVECIPMVLFNVKKIKGAADKNGLKT